MGAIKSCWPLAVLILGILFSVGARALTVDNFETDGAAVVFAAAFASDSAPTPNDANMIGDRVITVNKTAGIAGVVNAAVAQSIDGLLGMANGPVTNSVVTVQWSFAETDLTEGGTQTGIFVSLPNPIDNDLAIAFSINDGAPFSKLFLNGASGEDFYFPFDEFANAADAETATSVSVSFANGPAWDAQVDFIATLGPPPPPPPPAPPPPGPPPMVPTMPLYMVLLTTLGLWVFAAQGLSRRKPGSSDKK